MNPRIPKEIPYFIDSQGEALESAASGNRVQNAWAPGLKLCPETADQSEGEMEAKVDEIADGVYRISAFITSGTSRRPLQSFPRPRR